MARATIISICMPPRTILPMDGIATRKAAYLDNGGSAAMPPTGTW